MRQVLALYQGYFDFKVRHFHEKSVEEYNLELSYTWVKEALHDARLVTKRNQRGRRRQRREWRPLLQTLLYIDGSPHQWFQDGSFFDPISIPQDAISKIY